MMAAMSSPAHADLAAGARRASLPLSLALIVVAGLNFSFLFSVNKVAAESGVPFFAYVFWYALGAGVILLLAAALRGELPKLSATHLRANVVAALLGFAGPFALLAFVAPKLPSGIAVLLIILTPAFTYLFALLARTERLHALSVSGLLLGLAGVLLVVVPSGSLPAPDMAGWVLLAMLAPVGFASLNIYVEKFRPPAAPSLALAVGILWTSALLLLPIMLATGQLYVFPGPVPRGDWAILGAVLINVLMWPLFYEIVRRTGAFLFSVMNIIGVVAGFGWGMLFFGETHSAYIWLAGALMLLGFGLIISRPVIGRLARR